MELKVISRYFNFSENIPNSDFENLVQELDFYKVVTCNFQTFG